MSNGISTMDLAERRAIITGDATAHIDMLGLGTMSADHVAGVEERGI